VRDEGKLVMSIFIQIELNPLLMLLINFSWTPSISTFYILVSGSSEGISSRVNVGNIFKS